MTYHITIYHQHFTTGNCALYRWRGTQKLGTEIHEHRQLVHQHEFLEFLMCFLMLCSVKVEGSAIIGCLMLLDYATYATSSLCWSLLVFVCLCDISFEKVADVSEWFRIGFFVCRDARP